MPLSRITKLGCGPAARSTTLCSIFLCATIFISSARAETFSVNACQKDNLALATLRFCLGLASAPGLTPGARAAIYTMRGADWLNEDEPAAAAADFSRAIAVDPGNAAALKGRATAYTKLGSHNLATNDWSLILKIMPDAEESYRQRGASLLAAGKADEAISDFSKAIEIKPKNVEAYMGRAGVYDKLNQRDKALKEFEMAGNVDPNYFPLYMAKGEAAVRWGETKLAIDSYKTVLRLNGFDWHARKALQRLGVVNGP